MSKEFHFVESLHVALRRLYYEERVFLFCVRVFKEDVTRFSYDVRECDGCAPYSGV
jgi:hypothetical protein